MKKLLDLGFKKIKTEPGFHMYELTPARLPVASHKLQAASNKQQAATICRIYKRKKLDN